MRHAISTRHHRRWKTGMLLLTALTAACGAATENTGPVIPGLHGKHPLSDSQTGHLLMAELRCAACHDGMAATGMKAAPDLRQVGSRLTGDYLQRFIAEPAAVHPGTTMPNVLASKPPEQRRQISESISHYLRSLRAGEKPGTTNETKPKATSDLKAGHEAFHSVGCVACHAPRDESGKETAAPGTVALTHLNGKFRNDSLAEFLFEPLKWRPSGRMPDMNLSRDEAALLAAFLTNNAPPSTAESPEPTPEQIKSGKALFREHNCASCHDMGDPELPSTKPGTALAALKPTQGCLAPQTGAAPDYQLAAVQRKAIQSALAAPKPVISSADQVKMRLTQLNCIACHVRDDYGGVAASLDSHFRTTEAGLGNEARIPPQLTLVGAKLRPEWLNKVLYDREKVRPYMLTRMPQFGESSLAGLPALFTEVDKLEPIVLPEPDDTNRSHISNGANLLLGDKGLNCIACHNFNGTPSPGMKGMDLMTSYQRLQPSWFYHYMKNPAKYRPGIIMPNYWPDGKAVQTEILGGDTDAQLQALWHQFSLGRSARDPSGLRAADIKLLATDKPVMHRGRSSVAGYRGIAVGFPGGINYAFNAQNGTLSAIWQGDFLNVNWRSQGAGDFNPAARSIQLAQDVTFLQREDAEAPWPLRPLTNKEQPVNPDPLYPRRLGYAFSGYSLDAVSIPTFRYRCGTIAIADKTVATQLEGKPGLRRTLNFDSPGPQTLWFRALTGKIEATSPSAFATPEIRLAISPPPEKHLLRQAATSKTGDKNNEKPAEPEQELLIPLSLPKGKTQLTLDYAPLR